MFSHYCTLVLAVSRHVVVWAIFFKGIKILKGKKVPEKRLYKLSQHDFRSKTSFTIIPLGLETVFQLNFPAFPWPQQLSDQPVNLTS